MGKLDIGSFRIPKSCYRINLVENRLFTYSFFGPFIENNGNYICSIVVHELMNGKELAYWCLIKDVPICVEESPDSFYYIGEMGEISIYFPRWQVYDKNILYCVYIVISSTLEDVILKRKGKSIGEYIKVKNLLSDYDSIVFPDISGKTIVQKDSPSVNKSLLFYYEFINPQLVYEEMPIYLDTEGKDFFNINIVSNILHFKIKNRLILLMLYLRKRRNIKIPKYILMKILYFMTYIKEE